MIQLDSVFMALAFAVTSILSVWIGAGLCDELSSRYPGLFERLRRSLFIRAVAVVVGALCVYIAVVIVNPVIRSEPVYLPVYAFTLFSASLILRLATGSLKVFQRFIRRLETRESKEGTHRYSQQRS